MARDAAPPSSGKLVNDKLRDAPCLLGEEPTLDRVGVFNNLERFERSDMLGDAAAFERCDAEDAGAGADGPAEDVKLTFPDLIDAGVVLLEGVCVKGVVLPTFRGGVATAVAVRLALLEIGRARPLSADTRSRPELELASLLPQDLGRNANVFDAEPFGGVEIVLSKSPSEGLAPPSCAIKTSSARLDMLIARLRRAAIA